MRRHDIPKAYFLREKKSIFFIVFFSKVYFQIYVFFKGVFGVFSEGVLHIFTNCIFGKYFLKPYFTKLFFLSVFLEVYPEQTFSNQSFRIFQAFASLFLFSMFTLDNFPSDPLTMAITLKVVVYTSIKFHFRIRILHDKYVLM